jgi:hypothetical protein
VPAGLDPAGVVAAKGRPRSSLVAKAGVAVAVAGVVALTAAAASSGEEQTGRPFEVPEIRFNTVIPVPGSALAPSRDMFVVLMVMSEEPVLPMTLAWRVELLGAPGVCLFMDGQLTGVQRPLGLALTGPLRTAADCGQQFDVASLRITIRHRDATIYDQTHALPYRIQP